MIKSIVSFAESKREDNLKNLKITEHLLEEGKVKRLTECCEALL